MNSAKGRSFAEVSNDFVFNRDHILAAALILLSEKCRKNVKKGKTCPAS
ncbi:MAG: hypothetical protein JRG97_04350 [Deltaproteobacteria bacterium]|nr:hypothetical protein [Deltaproteobacteria bacterium]MBW2140289.1 hypothetical protein [Deltaproteobacteria bacterium]MBW2322132.1 hypothetical protein [Deltaproteobacteria bacterium]